MQMLTADFYMIFVITLIFAGVCATTKAINLVSLNKPLF